MWLSLEYSRAMTDATDLDQLARRYLDLWQDQTAAMTNDPMVAAAMGQAYALMTQGMAALFTAGGSPATSKEATSKEATSTETGADDSTNFSTTARADAVGASPAAASSDDASVDSVRLALRVAELEKRVLRLEAALAERRGRTEKSDRRRRS